MPSPSDYQHCVLQVFGIVEKVQLWSQQARLLLGWAGNSGDKGQCLVRGLAQGERDFVFPAHSFESSVLIAGFALFV